MKDVGPSSCLSFLQPLLFPHPFVYPANGPQFPQAGVSRCWVMPGNPSAWCLPLWVSMLVAAKLQRNLAMSLPGRALRDWHRQTFFFFATSNPTSLSSPCMCVSHPFPPSPPSPLLGPLSSFRKMRFHGFQKIPFAGYHPVTRQGLGCAWKRTKRNQGAFSHARALWEALPP